MEHNTLKELLVLVAYDEADEAEKRLLNRHLEVCPACREEFAELTQLKSVVSETLASEPPEDLLASARQELALQMDDVKAGKIRFRRNYPFYLIPLHFSMLQIALSSAAVLLIAAGIYFFPHIGQATGQKFIIQGPAFAALPGNGAIAPVIPPRSAEKADNEANKTIADKSRRSSDESAEQLSTDELLKNENPGLRLRAITSVAERTNAGQSKNLKRALLYAMQQDANPGVRKEAMKALSHYAFDAEIRDALLHVLTTDKNAGLRIMAIDNLARKKDMKSLDEPGTVTVLEDRAAADGNSYVKLRAKSILTRIKS